VKAQGNNNKKQQFDLHCDGHRCVIIVIDSKKKQWALKPVADDKVVLYEKPAPKKAPTPKKPKWTLKKDKVDGKWLVEIQDSKGQFLVQPRVAMRTSPPQPPAPNGNSTEMMAPQSMLMHQKLMLFRAST